MLQQINEEFWKKHEKPGIKTPVNQKILTSCSCTSTQRKLANEQRVTEFLYQAVDL